MAHVVYKGPPIVKEIMIGFGLAFIAGAFWKKYHWDLQRRTREMYDLVDKGEISLVVEDE